jgi:hypothetical protein
MLNMNNKIGLFVLGKNEAFQTKIRPTCYAYASCVQCSEYFVLGPKLPPSESFDRESWITYSALEQIAQTLHCNVALKSIWHKIWTLLLNFDFYFLLTKSNLLYEDTDSVNFLRISRISK